MIPATPSKAEQASVGQTFFATTGASPIPIGATECFVGTLLPYAGTQLELRFVSGPSSIGSVYVTTDSSGNFTPSCAPYTNALPFVIPSVNPGTYTVYLYYGGVSTVYSTQFTVSGTTTGLATITVSPTSQVDGGYVQVTGSGFYGGASATVYITGSCLQQSSYNASDPNGSFGPTGINVSLSAAAGTCYITAQEVNSAYPRTATAYLQVGGTGTGGASITLNPIIAAPGTPVTVTGTGFSGSGYVTISATALGLTPVPVLDPGGVFSTSFVVPSTAYYSTYTVTGSDSYGRLATATLTVGLGTGGLTATPSTANPGQAIIVSGSGFLGSVPVYIYLCSALNTTTTSSSTGAISVVVTVPTTQALGSCTLTANDSYGHSLSSVEVIGTASSSLTASPNSGLAGSVITVNGAGFMAYEQVQVGLASLSSPTVFVTSPNSVYAANASGGLSISFTVPTWPVGSYELLAKGSTSGYNAYTPFTVSGVAATATATGTAPTATATPFITNTPGLVPFPSPKVPPTQATGPLAAVSTAPSTTYFAEGYTGTAATNHQATFTEKLYLYNPGSVASTATTTYYVYDTAHNTHTTVVEHDTVAPGTTTVRNVNTDAGNDRNVSIVVQASAGISAETFISRVAGNGGVLDSAASQGSPGLGQTWYLAEGYTGASIQEYLTIFNPGNVDAHTQVQYLPSDTAAPGARAYTVPANGRLTINVRSDYNGLVKHGSRNIGLSVSSDQPVAVDRSTYWGDGSGSGKYGYAIGSGISAGQTTQYFSYLPTSNGSQSFVTVLNANAGAASTTLTLRDSFGGLIVSTPANILPGQRRTFSIPTLVAGSMGVLSGTLTSSLPVVAEAGIYFGGSPNIGTHPGLVVRGTIGASTGSRADVAPAGAQLRIVNVSGGLIHVQVLGKGSSQSTLYDANLANRAAANIQIPAGSDPSSVTVLGSGAFSATLVNGGFGSPTAWGGNLS